MSRYIDADAYLHELEELIRARLDWTSIGKIEIQGLTVAICELENQPTADVVEVVRCRDCINFNKYEDCDVPNAFCSEGERREDGEIH